MQCYLSSIIIHQPSFYNSHLLPLAKSSSSSSRSTGMSEVAAPTRYRIGIALEPKKVQTFLQNSLIHHANHRGIDLIQIDTTAPLTEQGPFHAIIHKLYTQQWTQHLHEFSSKNPNIPIIDPPESLNRLHNRVTMLDSVTQLRIPALQNDAVVVGVPKQLVVNSQKEAYESIDDSSLRFPIIAKPLVADGTASSHKLCLVFDREGFSSLSYPVVLQEFVNHGGVVFKIYVAGNHVTCVKRKSLPDITEEEMTTVKGAVPFSQVSNLKGSRDEDGGVEMPPEGLVSEIGRGLKEALGLNLFNVDVIRDVKESTRYLVIDINYFPGYAKLPCYEPFFTDFLLDVVQQKPS